MRDFAQLKYRPLMLGGGFEFDETARAFQLTSPIDGGALRVIASINDGWDHVSVSRSKRCPNWPEMSYVAQEFFLPDEVAMQLHVPAGDHINNHPFCLHWWRPQGVAIPLPPAWMVGKQGIDPERMKQLVQKARQFGLGGPTGDEIARELGVDLVRPVPR